MVAESGVPLPAASLGRHHSGFRGGDIRGLPNGALGGAAFPNFVGHRGLETVEYPSMEPEFRSRSSLRSTLACSAAAGSREARDSERKLLVVSSALMSRLALMESAGRGPAPLAPN